MAVISVNQAWSSESSQLSSDGGRRSVLYQVVAVPTTGTDVIEEIEAHASIPQRGDAHPDVAGRWVTTVETHRRGGPNSYDVLVTYESLQPVVPGTNPVSLPGWWTDVQWEVSEVAADTDLDDIPVINSAGEPFDPPITVQVVSLSATWNKNFTAGTATFGWLESWANCVNTSAITGVAAAGELLIFPGPTAERVPAADGAPAYDRVSFPIRFRRGAGGKAWWRIVLDRGLREKTGVESGGAPELQTIVDRIGSPLNQPSLLNGAGLRLNAAAAPVWLEFRLIRDVNMAALAILPP